MQLSVGKIFFFFFSSLIDGAQRARAPCVIEFFGRLHVVRFFFFFWRGGASLSAEHAESTLQQKRHCCHPICFHWQKRLQQEKHECWFFSMCIPDLWKQSLFSHSPAERRCAAGKGCLFSRLSHSPRSTSQPRSIHYSVFFLREASPCCRCLFEFITSCTCTLNIWGCNLVVRETNINVYF